MLQKEENEFYSTQYILLQHIRPTYVSSLGRPRTLELYYYVPDRISYILRTGCQWSNLPVQNGSWKNLKGWNGQINRFFFYWLCHT